MSVAYNTAIVLDRLVLCLDAANPKSYPGTGTNWNDLSGNRNNSILTNGVTYSTIDNGIMVFDGITNYVATPYNITGKINVTFVAWVKLLSYPPVGKSDVIFDQSTGSTGCAFFITPTGNLQGVVFNSSAVGLGSTSSLVIPLNQWKMLSLSFQNNRINYYMNLDNAFIDPSAGVIDIIKLDPTNNLRIATTVDGNVNYENLNGYISDVMIYEKVLDFVETQQNFNALRGRYGI